jgi:oxygen-dependent protoporphyrinogen oxidase
MKGKLLLLAGAAVGYVFGTRAGRERYEQIKENVNKAWNDPRVQEKVTEAEHFVSETASKTVPQMQEKLGGAAAAARSKFGGDEQTSPANGDQAIRSQSEYAPTQDDYVHRAD